MFNDLLRYHGDRAARGARLDFAVNVHGETPDWLKEAVIGGVDELAAYPDEELANEVRSEIARIHGRSPAEVLLLHGVAEGFSLLPSLGLPATIIAPQFTEPEAAFLAAGSECETLALKAPFTLDSPLADAHPAAHSGLASRLTGRMAIVGNPTNPTGVLHSAEALLELSRSAEILVVDEAFMDVVDGQAAAEASLADASTVSPFPDNVIVFRSMTKTWAIAGLRCGYALGSPKLLECLGRLRPHWPLGTLQLRAMLEIARRSGQLLPAIRAEIASQRGQMERDLSNAGWAVMPSAAPFVLAKAPLGNRGEDGEGVGKREWMRKALAERGIAVRRCDTFRGLDSRWWRLAVRDRDCVRQLIEAVEQVHYAGIEKYSGKWEEGSNR